MSTCSVCFLPHPDELFVVLRLLSWPSPLSFTVLLLTPLLDHVVRSLALCTDSGLSPSWLGIGGPVIFISNLKTFVVLIGVCGSLQLWADEPHYCPVERSLPILRMWVPCTNILLTKYQAELEAS